ADGARWGVGLHFSYEGATPLETGGGMHHALAVLRDQADPDAPFIAVNGDVWTDYDFDALPNEPTGDAHLVMVDNPPQHSGGDFSLDDGGRLTTDGEPRLTFSGIGLYRPSLLDDWKQVIGAVEGVERQPPRFKLAPLLRAAMSRGRVSGEHHRGRWTDVGTPQRLAELDEGLRTGPHPQKRL